MIKLLNQEDSRYKIDYSEPVRVYKNLHRNCWSVKQDGLVKVHTHHVNLFNCKFLVSKKGRLKVLKEKRKNVHAFIEGYMNKEDCFDCGSTFAEKNEAQISYDPYFKETFFTNHDLFPVYDADEVRLIYRFVFMKNNCE
jgi:hypothetical protein